MPNPVMHWEIVGGEGKQLQEFYSGLFGWSIDSNNPYDYGLVDTQTSRGINGGIGPTDGPTRVTVYIEVDDIQSYLDKAISMGATLMMPVTELPGAATLALFADPAGNVTGLLKSTAPADAS